MNEDIQKLLSRLFIVKWPVYLIAGAFGAEFVSVLATHVDGGQPVV